MSEPIIGQTAADEEFKRTLLTEDTKGNKLDWWFGINKDGVPHAFKLTKEDVVNIMAGRPFLAYHPLMMVEGRPVYLPGSFNSLDPWFITETFKVVAQIDPVFSVKLDKMMERTFNPPTIAEATPGEAALAAKQAERQRGLKLVK